MAYCLLNRPQYSSSLSFPVDKAREELRILTYNVRIDHAEDRDNHHSWLFRKGLVASLISAYSPDVIALQEVNEAQRHDLSSLLPQFSFEGFPVGLGSPTEERLLFGYQSNINLLDAAVFSLSDTPNLPVKAWDARYARVVVYGKFRIKANGRQFILFNTHLDHRGQIARGESVKQIVNLQRSLALTFPRLIVGDFNAYPDAGGGHIYTVMTSPDSGLHDLRDLVEEPPYGPDGTWIGWEYEPSRAPNGAAGHRLDHIFVGGALKIRRCGVLDSSIDPISGKLIAGYFGILDAQRRFPSDHLPVITDITL